MTAADLVLRLKNMANAMGYKNYVNSGLEVEDYHYFYEDVVQLVSEVDEEPSS